MNRLLLGAWLVLAPHLACSAATCRLLSGNGLAFGLYDVLVATPRDSQVTVTVTCEGTGTPQNVLLMVRVDQGSNGTSVQSRRMSTAGGAGTLNYGLFRDPGRSSIWGVTEGVDTVGTTLAVPGTGAVSARFTIYGRIPPGQDARPGSYGDAVQVTINY